MNVRFPHDLLQQMGLMSKAWNISSTEIVRRSLRAYSNTVVDLEQYRATTTRTNSMPLKLNIETELEPWQVVAATAWNVAEHKDAIESWLNRPIFVPDHVEGVHYTRQS